MVYASSNSPSGHIKIYSEADPWATFRQMYLPAGQGATAASRHRTGNREASAAGSETVLQWSRTDAAGTQACRRPWCSRSGYAPRRQTDAAEALALIDASPRHRPLFTDVVMPGAMNGRQLADEALRQRPAVEGALYVRLHPDALLHHGRLDPGGCSWRNRIAERIWRAWSGGHSIPWLPAKARPRRRPENPHKDFYGVLS